MKLIFDFEYLNNPVDGEPTRYTILDTVNSPNIGECIYWRVVDGDIPYRVQDKSHTYENGILIQTIVYLEKS